MKDVFCSSNISRVEQVAEIVDTTSAIAVFGGNEQRFETIKRKFKCEISKKIVSKQKDNFEKTKVKIEV